MADIVKPKIKARYYIITTEKFPSYDKAQYKRYLRYSDTEPTDLATGEEVIKSAVVTYPDEDPEDPNFKYELDTDPIALSGWDPTGKAWGSCQDWLFYDPKGARDYVDPNNVVTEATIGGFMKLDPTYFYYDSEGLYQGSGEWKDRGSNTATLTAPLIDNELADPNKNEIKWVDNNWVIDPLPEKIIGYPEFTYVVDSDETLAAWATNNHDKGQDYTSVLIRKGTWTYNNAIFLSTSGTKAIVGEPGSVIELPSYITYTNNVYQNDCYATGVTLSIISPPSTASWVIGFRYLSNLTNCRCIINHVVSSATTYGYEGCHNVINSVSEVTNNSTSSKNSHGFHNCTDLINCHSMALRGTESTNNMTTRAFASCSRLTNCVASAHSRANGTYGEGHGFYNCHYLTNCVATTGANSVNGGGRGFISCDHMENCYTTATTSEWTNIGLDFYECKSVHNCKAGSGSSEPYRSVYASSTAISDYLAADTPAGGFNS